MAVQIEQVRVWLRYRNVWHVVVSRQGYYHATACGTWGNHGSIEHGSTPTRICRKCREALKTLEAAK